MLFGNIGSSVWQYNEIEDIRETLIKTMIFFLADFSSAVLTALILWLSCGINLWRIFTELQKEFRTSFGVILGYGLIVVSKVESNIKLNCKILIWNLMKANNCKYTFTVFEYEPDLMGYRCHIFF